MSIRSSRHVCRPCPFPSARMQHDVAHLPPATFPFFSFPIIPLGSERSLSHHHGRSLNVTRSHHPGPSYARYQASGCEYACRHICLLLLFRYTSHNLAQCRQLSFLLALLAQQPRNRCACSKGGLRWSIAKAINGPCYRWAPRGYDHRSALA